MGTSPGTTTERARQKILLVDGREYLGDASLQSPVSNTRHTQGALLLLSGLRDIYSPDIRRSVSPTVNRLKHLFDPDLEVLLCLRHCLSIYPGSRVSRNLTQVLPYPLLREVMR
jgi:hypothetical protein